MRQLKAYMLSVSNVHTSDVRQSMRFDLVPSVLSSENCPIYLGLRCPEVFLVCIV